MNSKQEKTLRSILKSYGGESMPIYMRRSFRVVEFIVLVCLLLAARALLESSGDFLWLGLLLAITVGVAIGFVSVLRFSQSCVPYIKPFIDLDGIERALGEKQ